MVIQMATSVATPVASAPGFRPMAMIDPQNMTAFGFVR